jgi:hypothetical protein
MLKTIGVLTLVFLFVLYLPEMLETADRCIG